MLRLFRAGLKPYIGLLVFLLLLLIVQAFSSLYLPSIMSDIINNGVLSGNIDYIQSEGGFMMLVAIISSSAAIIVGYLASKIGVGFCTDTRKRLFQHIDKFTLAEFDKIDTGSLTTRTTNDILQVQNFLVMFLRLIVLAPIMCIGGILLSFQKNMQVGIVVLVFMPVILLFLILVLRKVFPVFDSVQSKLDKVNLVLKENITGVRVIRAFTAEQREESRFEHANNDMTQVSIKSQVIIATFMPMIMLILNVGTVFVVWSGGQQVSYSAMQVGDIMAVIQYLMLIMYALVIMAFVFSMMPRALSCSKRINEVFDIQPQIVNAENLKSPPNKTGVVEFKDVSLSYGDAEHPAVSGISFTANPGETTAIIGATGSGKSSIICLIPRLRDVTGGSVTVDGMDVRNYDLDALRSRIGYVPQKAVLFAGTIRSNIAFGDEDMPDEQVERAARIAQADDFIRRKKRGYEDPIAQGGTNVSGGQRQRLAIARAMATKASIFIFDDSFSALDFKTDAALRQAIKDNTDGATVIIVAQRINTILNADKILVLDQGRIVGEGRHQELLKTCGIYAEIARTQMAQGGDAK